MNATSTRRPHVTIFDRVLRYLDALIFVAFAIFVIWQRDYGMRFRIGTAVAAIAIVLWAIARLQRASSFLISAQGRRLVTHGVYSKIRNPIYIFAGLGYLGLFIALGNWVALALFVLLYAYQIRVKREERLLEQVFGLEYRRYKARTWF